VTVRGARARDISACLSILRSCFTCRYRSASSASDKISTTRDRMAATPDARYPTTSSKSIARYSSASARCPTLARGRVRQKALNLFTLADNAPRLVHFCTLANCQLGRAVPLRGGAASGAAYWLAPFLFR
jgi:hypothetical protein